MNSYLLTYIPLIYQKYINNKVKFYLKYFIFI